jgi:hypothetical protein
MSTAALVGSTLLSSATVVAQRSPQVADQVAVRGEILGLARDAVGVEESSLDSERLAQGELWLVADPTSEDSSALGDEPRLPVVLLAVEGKYGRTARVHPCMGGATTTMKNGSSSSCAISSKSSTPSAQLVSSVSVKPRAFTNSARWTVATASHDSQQSRMSGVESDVPTQVSTS